MTRSERPYLRENLKQTTFLPKDSPPKTKPSADSESLPPNVSTIHRRMMQADLALNNGPPVSFFRFTFPL